MPLMTRPQPHLPGTLEGLVALATSTLDVIADQQAVLTDLSGLLARIERHLEGQASDRSLLLLDTREALRLAERERLLTRPWLNRLGGR